MRAEPPLEGTPTPIGVDVAVDLVAGQLDAAFLTAGQALATAFEFVEGLVSGLAEVTGAVDREDGQRAIADMQATAARIEHLPARIASRADALADIASACRAVNEQVAGVARTIEFLRICGLNIKVASGGLAGFAEFADGMLARLDFSEGEMRSIRREAQSLQSIIPSVLAVDRVLAEECRGVAGEVPRQMAANARALQEHLQAAEGQAMQVAAVVARLRGHLGEALGAMQIGDITRQRLEHVAAGYRILNDEIGLDALDDPARRGAARRVLALLEAQNDAAIGDFNREGRRLGELQQLIGADIAEMLTFQAMDHPAGNSGDLLQALERGVGGIGALIGKLQEADRRSLGLSGDATATVNLLSQRLSLIHRVTAEVDNMAWNTDLRCYRMGPEGQGLARIAVEIRALVGTLKAICVRVDSAIAQLTRAATAIAGGPGDDSGHTLHESLSIISAGAVRANGSLAQLDRQAAAATQVIGDAVDAVAAIDRLSAPLDAAATQLRSMADGLGTGPATESDLATPVLDAIAKLYTMASQRELHRHFAPVVAQDDGEVVEATEAQDEDDDGLF